MFTHFAMLNLGYRTGLRKKEIPLVEKMHEEGKTPKEISEKLRVDQAVIEKFCGEAPLESIEEQADMKPKGKKKHGSV